MTPSETEARRSPSVWVLALVLVTPLLFGAILEVFPVDRNRVLAAVLACLGVAAACSLVAVRVRTSRVLRAAPAGVCLLVLSVPFWALEDGGDSTRRSSEPDAAVYSYRAAEADPRAFARWWAFFVAEVARTNKIVFERDESGKPDYQGILPYRPIPGASVDFHKGRIDINHLGYRGDEFPRSKGHEYRILVIGDSVTFGQTLFPDSRPWSFVLQDLIDDNLVCNRRIRVVNGAVNGFRLENAIDRIERDQDWLQADMVLSNFGWNSMADLGVQPTDRKAAQQAALPSDLRSRLLWHVMERWRSVAAAAARTVNPLSDTRSADDESMLRIARQGSLHGQYQKLIEQAGRRNFRLVLLSFNTAVTPDSSATAIRFYEGPWPGVRLIIRQVRVHNEMIRQLAAERNVHFVDTSNGLLGRFDGDLYLDVVHFTTRGDAVMASNVFKGARPLLMAEPGLGCRLRR